MERIPPYLSDYLAIIREVLGRRLLKVYWWGEEGSQGPSDMVVLVEHRAWGEELAIREGGIRMKEEWGCFLSPLIVNRSKWEHWRRLGKELVSRVESQAFIIYEREDLIET